MISFRIMYYKLYDAAADALVEFGRGNDANMAFILEKAMRECDEMQDEMEKNKLKRGGSKKPAPSRDIT